MGPRTALEEWAWNPTGDGSQRRLWCGGPLRVRVLGHSPHPMPLPCESLRSLVKSLSPSTDSSWGGASGGLEGVPFDLSDLQFPQLKNGDHSIYLPGPVRGPDSVNVGMAHGHAQIRRVIVSSSRHIPGVLGCGTLEEDSVSSRALISHDRASLPKSPTGFRSWQVLRFIQLCENVSLAFSSGEIDGCHAA